MATKIRVLLKKEFPIFLQLELKNNELIFFFIILFENLY